LGSALCRLLANRGFEVAALGREAALAELSQELPNALTLQCDLSRAIDVERAFSTVETRLGPPTLVVYNAHRIELLPFAETSHELFEQAWRDACFGAFNVAQRALPAMLQRGSGSMLFSGASSSVRGGRRSAAFASSKFALRGLAQSLAREYSSSGIHVAHVVLDGLIWSERTRARFNPEPHVCMSAEDVALAYLSLLEQPRSAWTHELELKPWRSR
jgi:NAD(P)-dependent dehydrogenase (short-subunit alcohol dehydrogenase family)